MKKIYTILLILLLCISLVACKKDENLDDKPTEVIEAGKVIVKELYDDIDLKDYDYTYVDEEMNGEYILFYPEGVDVEIVKIFSLEYRDDELVELDLKDEFLDIKDGERLLLDVVIPEGIPSLKLKWEVNGKEDEYIIQYDGRGESKGITEFNY